MFPSPSPKVLLCFLITLWFFGHSQVGFAHSGTKVTVIQQVELSLFPDKVIVDYTIELPYPSQLLPKLADLEREQTTLMHGLILQTNPPTTPLTLQEVLKQAPNPARHSFSLQLRLSAPLQFDDELELTLTNGNISQRLSMLSQVVRVDPSIAVTSSSLLVEGTSGIIDRSGTWGYEPEYRTLQLIARKQTSPLERLWLSQEQLPPLTLKQAHLLPLQRKRTTWVVTIMTFFLLLTLTAWRFVRR
jgi:hypothetical protein